MNRNLPFHFSKAFAKISSRVLLWAILLTGYCLISTPAYAQDVLWGLTSNIGPKGAGTAFSIKSTGDDFTIRHAFSKDPSTPTGSLAIGSDGYLYGMTSGGGEFDSGTIFKIAPDGSVFSVLHSFRDSTDGVNPSGGLIEASNGYLYGMTSTGGEYNAGTIFKIALNGTGFIVLKSFNSSLDSLSSPQGSLVKGSDGYLYGLIGGGQYNAGAIFKMAVDGTGFTVLKQFGSSATDGYGPTGLIEGRNGDLYGTTVQGGETGYGTIFKMAVDGTGFTVFYSFDGYNGSYPGGSLIEGSDNNFYGITYGGGYFGAGAIFKINPDGTNFTVLSSYDEDTGVPVGLTEGDDGFLYFMTPYGPNNGPDNFYGSIFQISLDFPHGGWMITLEEYNGAYPVGSLVKASDGNLYGMTREGGETGYGTIFKIATDAPYHDAPYHSIIKSLSSPEGTYPSSSLIEGRDGFFYGMTNKGGHFGYGTVFKLDPDGLGLTVLKSFNGEDGAFPYGSLIEGSDGFLYGMTLQGSKKEVDFSCFCYHYGYGTIFKIAPDGSGFKVLKSFNPLIEGAAPGGNLIQGSDGYLYGVTSQDNNFGVSTIFKLTSDGSNFTILKSFDRYNSNDADAPSGSLTEGSNGNFYGISGGGDNNVGAIYKIASDGSAYTVLKSFVSATDGAYPVANLIKRNNGYLYGMTNRGGQYDGGTVFNMKTDGTGFTVLKSFNDTTDGASPEGSLVEGSDGILYGVTNKGGSYNGGTIFKIAQDEKDFSILKNFNPSTDGAAPHGSLVIQKGNIPVLPALQINFQDKHTKTPQGWLKDYGLPFGEKPVADSTLTYGWKNRGNGTPINLSIGGTFPGNTGNGRWRPTPADPLLATLMHMQGNDVKNFRGTPVESYWELAVENGDYQVTVSVGDGLRYTYSDPESHSINVEGIPAITHFVPQGPNGSLQRFKQATVKVKVEDGNLTVDADGGTNTKINYAIIQPLSASAAIARKDYSLQGAETQTQLKAYPNPFSNKLTIETKLQGNVVISLFDLMGKTYYQATHTIEAADMELDLSQVTMKAGIYLIKLQVADGTTQLIKAVKK